MPARTHTTELLERFAEGNEEAYQRLYDRYRSSLLGFIRGHTDPSFRRRISAEDLLQETHLEALKGLPSFHYRRETAFFLWLCGIARRRIYHHCRRWRRRPPPVSFQGSLAGSVSSSDLLRTLVSPEAGPFETLKLHEHLELLAAAVEAIPEPDRQAIVLRYVEGYSSAEAARTLGVSSGALRVRLSRALLRLRDAFDDLLLPQAEGRGEPVP
jgi:RNA polymerase sigma-70 factor (ECF subfamily)